MTSVAKPRRAKAKAVKRRCAFCKKVFVDRSETSPRTYCDDHRTRASRVEKARSSPMPKVRKIVGEPFTVRHFRSWTRRLTLTSGRRFELEPWEADYAEDVFEAVRGRLAGTSSVRQVWLVVPEGNGKSSLVAALCLYVLEFTPGAKVPIAASSRDQAKATLYEPARDFVERSSHLRGRFVCQDGNRELRFGRDATPMARIYAADEGTGDGIIPYPLELVDELHRHKTLGLYRTWKGKLDKELAVMIVISTAGEPGSEFEQVREEMRQKASTLERRGRCFARYRAETYVLHEYAVPEEADVDDLELVAEANPSPRITVETLRQKREDPGWELAHWRRLTCNLPTRALRAAITELEWARALAPADRRAIPPGATIDLGYDAAWSLDTTAIVPLWVPKFDFRLIGEPTIIEPPGSGVQIEPDEVKAAINFYRGRYSIRWLVADPSWARDILAWARDEGLEVVEKPQAPLAHALDYERFMEALRNGWLWHSGDPTLKQHVLNAIARPTDSGKLRFDRPRESRTVSDELKRRRVVDGLTAAAMVHTVAVADMEETADEPMIAWSFA